MSVWEYFCFFNKIIIPLNIFHRILELIFKSIPGLIKCRSLPLASFNSSCPCSLPIIVCSRCGLSLHSECQMPLFLIGNYLNFDPPPPVEYCCLLLSPVAYCCLLLSTVAYCCPMCALFLPPNTCGGLSIRVPRAHDGFLKSIFSQPFSVRLKKCCPSIFTT